jgi:flagellum-specific peptidoglycan hydrolase FlgJ
MKQAKQRVNIAIETQLNHAYYDNWRESLEDYGYYYCSYLNKIETEEEYFNYLSQSYAESPNYVERLKKIIDSLNLKKEFN